MHMRNSIPCGLINEYMYQNGVNSSIQTVFFHSTCRYHLHICRPEFYYECDWNGARIIVIVRQTKKMICQENSDEDFAIATLKRISNCLEDFVSHKACTQCSWYLY